MDRLTIRLKDQCGNPTDSIILRPYMRYQDEDTKKTVLNRLAYYEDLEEQGRLIILTVKDIHPCRSCGVGWGSISSEGCHSCHETCIRLKEYNEKYNK